MDETTSRQADKRPRRRLDNQNTANPTIGTSSLWASEESDRPTRQSTDLSAAAVESRGADEQLRLLSTRFRVLAFT